MHSRSTLHAPLTTPNTQKNKFVYHKNFWAIQRPERSCTITQMAHTTGRPLPSGLSQVPEMNVVALLTNCLVVVAILVAWMTASVTMICRLMCTLWVNQDGYFHGKHNYCLALCGVVCDGCSPRSQSAGVDRRISPFGGTASSLQYRSVESTVPRTGALGAQEIRLASCHLPPRLCC